jgi:hypothetical protein
MKGNRNMYMDYLPLGKEGCENCKDMSCYCDDCTKKILDAVGIESQQQAAQQPAEREGGEG